MSEVILTIDGKEIHRTPDGGNGQVNIDATWGRMYGSVADQHEGSAEINLTIAVHNKEPFDWNPTLSEGERTGTIQHGILFQAVHENPGCASVVGFLTR